jgi:hypothetical protein
MFMRLYHEHNNAEINTKETLDISKRICFLYPKRRVKHTYVKPTGEQVEGDFDLLVIPSRGGERAA